MQRGYGRPCASLRQTPGIFHIHTPAPSFHRSDISPYSFPPADTAGLPQIFQAVPAYTSYSPSCPMEKRFPVPLPFPSFFQSPVSLKVFPIPSFPLPPRTPAHNKFKRERDAPPSAFPRFVHCSMRRTKPLVNSGAFCVKYGLFSCYAFPRRL